MAASDSNFKVILLFTLKAKTSACDSCVSKLSNSTSNIQISGLILIISPTYPILYPFLIPFPYLIY
jgi:hypothetical protein